MYHVEGKWEKLAAREEIDSGTYIVADDDIDPCYAALYALQTQSRTYPAVFKPAPQTGRSLVCWLTACIGRYLMDCCVDSGASFLLLNELTRGFEKSFRPKYSN